MQLKVKNALTSLFFFVLSLCNFLTAQNVSFKTTAPIAVEKGETFLIAYTLENAEVEGAIQIPSSIKGFDILFGPATATSSSMSIVNGKTTSSSSISYRYTLSAVQVGNFTIPSATINANGKTYKSNSVQIKVLPPDKKNPRQNNNKSSSSTSANVKSSDAFIKAIVSKTKIYEQEAFVVTFRFYTTLNVRDVGKIEFPEFEGFLVEDQDLPGSRQLKVEHYNGRNYYSVDLRRTLLFPQRSGVITIPQGKIEMLFSVNSGKTADSFWGPQPITVDVKKTLTTEPINVKVSELPTAGKPASFSNAVGSFSASSTISATNIKANDGVTLKFVITGTGNTKLIKTPELDLPKDFEIYDPKITNDLKFTDNGLSGSKTIEYFFIPRYEGTYKIKPIEFSYFDIKSNSYKTIKTPEYTLNVAKDPNAGKNSSSNFTQTDVKIEQDIRYNKTGQPTFIKVNDFLFGSLVYYLWFIIPSVLFIAFFSLNRKKIKENADIVRTRTKQANKIAIKRLKQAKVYLLKNQSEKFYEEVLRATWGYLSDKLSIPVSQLSRDNIELELINFDANKSLIDKFIYVLDTCEFARYAPVESDTAMSDLYDDAVNAIEEMESSKKRNRIVKENNISNKYR